MLKINLLPPYIFERRKVRQAAFIAVLAFMMVLGGMLAWWYTLNKARADLQLQVQEMEARRDEVVALQKRVEAEEAKIPPIQQKLDFIDGLLKYIDAIPNLYEELARYTYARIRYTSIKPSSDTLSIEAYARSLGDCGRYLLNMYRASHIFSSVTISSVPGYPSGAARGNQGFTFTVTCKLVNPITPPQYAGVSTEAQAGGAPVTGGVPGTFVETPPPSQPPGGQGIPSVEELQQAESTPPPGYQGE
ncbi:MAG: hypothetical protein QME62_09225 [Armatimonadota bacterium]|nr:hypothetical protein [Armatimonadota bacterium]